MIRFDKHELSARSDQVHESRAVVRFQDVDAAGVVFFARFFNYVHIAYEDFLARLGCALPDVLQKKTWAAPIRHVEADYLAPVRYGDTLRIRLVAAQVEPSEITLGWCLEKDSSAKDSRCVCAVAQSVHTFIEVHSRKRRSVPEEIAQALGSLAEV